MRRLAFLLLIGFLLTACRAGATNTPFSPANFSRVVDEWEIRVEEDASGAWLTRTVSLDSELSSLLRGSPALAPTALEAALMADGATGADCRLDDGGSGITVSCRAHLAVAQTANRGHLSLPSGALVTFLGDLPLEAARGIDVDMRGEIHVAGALATLPAPVEQRFVNGGYRLQRYEIHSFSQLAVLGKMRFPPGAPAAASLESTSVAFIPRYFPRPAAWLAMGAALVAVLLAIARLYPVRKRQPVEPALWLPDLGRMPRLLRWLARLIVRLVNWLQRNWPRLLNDGVGAALTAGGALLILFAWQAAKLHDDGGRLRLLAHYYLRNLPVASGGELFLWPGWPLVLALAGVILIVVAVGLYSRYEAARVLVAGSLAALIFGLILVWPHLLLAPPLVPAQLGLLLILGASMLLPLTLLTRGLTHPQFRAYYLNLLDLSAREAT